MAEVKKEIEKKPVSKTEVAKPVATAKPANTTKPTPAVKPAEKATTSKAAATPKATAPKIAEAKPAAVKTPVKTEATKAAPAKKVEEKKPEVKKAAPAPKAKKEAHEKGKPPYVSNGEVRVTLIRSVTGSTVRQIRTVQALGLRKINDEKLHKDNPAIQGMCSLVAHLVKVEKVN